MVIDVVIGSINIMWSLTLINPCILSVIKLTVSLQFTGEIKTLVRITVDCFVKLATQTAAFVHHNVISSCSHLKTT